jgi:hypothetical protein
MDNKLRVLRRVYGIDALLKYRLDHYDNMIETMKEFGLCNESEKYFFDTISQWVIQQMYYNNFADVDDTSKEWEEMYGTMEKYIDTMYGKTIRDFFTDRCSQTN